MKNSAHRRDLPIRRRIAVLVFVALASCSSNREPQQQSRDTIDLSHSTYRVIKAGATGQDTGWSVLFCLIPVTAPATDAVAKTHLYDGIDVQGKEIALNNLRYEKHHTFLLLACRQEVDVSADVVEIAH
jgi:hypothetical protein